MYYIGLDVHMRTISYCVKDDSGTIHAGHKKFQMKVEYSYPTPKHTLAAVEQLAGAVSATPTNTKTSTGTEEQIFDQMPNVHQLLSV